MDQYLAADERARRARTAGLQAKKDEQPANTARSYRAKQREWRTWCLAPRTAIDGSGWSWPDGELVTPDKLAAWLQEDILLRRVKPPKARRRPRPLQQQTTEQQQLLEAKALAETLQVPLREIPELLTADREDYVPPTALAALAEEARGQQGQQEEQEEVTEGALLTKGTIDAYIAAVIELWRVQVAHGSHNTENPRGAAVRGFLEQRGR